jgi:hypothetical protein
VGEFEHFKEISCLHLHLIFSDTLVLPVRWMTLCQTQKDCCPKENMIMAHLSNSWFALCCLTCCFCIVKGRGGTDDEVTRKLEKQSQPFKVLFQHLYVLCIFIMPAGTLWLSWQVFPCFFLSCKANARVKPAKTGHGLHYSKMFVLFHVLFVLYHSVYCLCVNVYCTTATGWVPNTVNKYISYGETVRNHENS